jgi:hypothetical protein
MRILIEYIVPILLPTALWFAWLAWAGRHSAGKGREWKQVPITWLLSAGFVLAMLIAVGGMMITGYSTGHYRPASLDQRGHVVPGGFD